MRAENRIVPISEGSKLKGKNCHKCNITATHCILTPNDKIPCCTKQICIFPLLREAGIGASKK